MKKTNGLVMVLLVLTLVFAAMVVAQPTGVTYDRGASERGTATGATTQQAQAGNVTQLNINATSITQVWQGFYGNVSGEIMLADSSNNRFYDWTLTTITGEVYASRATISDWTGINCTNTSTISAEETTLNIGVTDSDGINETFGAGSTHPGFSVGTGVTITGGTCPETRPYNSTGTASEFYNVLLTSSGNNIVYTSVLVDSSNAFDGTTVDFEILVPTDKTTGLATYYFYAELG